MNDGAARAVPFTRTCLTTAGAAPGSIIAAIIVVHVAMKNPNGPGRVATPMSMPPINHAAAAQHAAASPIVVASTIVGASARRDSTSTISVPSAMRAGGDLRHADPRACRSR